MPVTSSWVLQGAILLSASYFPPTSDSLRLPFQIDCISNTQSLCETSSAYCKHPPTSRMFTLASKIHILNVLVLSIGYTLQHSL